ncbi:MAG: hypothetical protein A2Y92_02780 [Chloroflexi bacterium RBG_13_57_8]|nr:MAG: hypothetical protein A2Y92_02780 [Chloroflexi bacterium RBG_13_57_8]
MHIHFPYTILELKELPDVNNVKHKSIYLFLTLACFVGIVLIFIFDGYLGLYETLTATGTNFPQKIDTEQWQQQEKYGGAPGINVESSGDIPFTYEVDNRRFVSYTADIDISLWHGQSRLADIKSAALALGAFGGEKVEFTVDFANYLPDNLPAQTGYDFIILIKRGEIERRVNVFLSPILIPKVPLGR